MLKTLKSKPKRSAFIAVVLAVIALFCVRAALRIRSLEQLYRHPGIVEKLENTGKTHLKERLGLEVPEDFELDISMSEDNRVWLEWHDGDTETHYTTVFMNASCLLGPGRIQQLSAYIVLDAPDSAAPYAVGLMEDSERIFERMLDREIPAPSLYTMTVFADSSMTSLFVILTQNFDTEGEEFPFVFNAYYRSDLCDFEHFAPNSFSAYHQEKKYVYGCYDDAEIEAMVSLAEAFVSNILGDSHSLLSYSVRTPVMNRRRGLVCTFSCGPEAESLVVYVQDNEVREWYFWG